MIREKIASFLKKPVSSITDEAILTDLVPESFLLVELVIELQEEFGVRLMQSDLKDVKTVSELIAVIEKQQHRKPGNST